MNKLEAKLTTRFGHWVAREHKTLPPFVFEAKALDLTKGKSIGLRDFKPHQLPNLRKATDGGVYWKIPDLGSQNPFDGFFFKGVAWVVLFWYLPRKYTRCTIINIEDFDQALERLGKKSLREDEATAVAWKVIQL